MAASRSKSSSFTRAFRSGSDVSSSAAGIRLGPNVAMFVSSGISDLDKILRRPLSGNGGGGDGERGVPSPSPPLEEFHVPRPRSQPAPPPTPAPFWAPSLLPSPPPPTTTKLPVLPRAEGWSGGYVAWILFFEFRAKEEGLRIAWQYKKYFGEQPNLENQSEN